MRNTSDIDFTTIERLSDLIRILKDKGISDNQLWRFVGEYQENKAKDRGIPLSGQFELTPLCNLDCKMCYVHLNNEQSGESVLTVEKWKDLISQAHSCGMMNAVLTGGECLTYPGFDEIYMFLRSLGIRTSIKTNGLLLNKERIDFFNKYSPRSVTISVYGSSNDAYKKVTGYSVFDSVYKNLLLAKNGSFPINIAITPSKYMRGDILNIIDLARKLDVPYTVNMMLFPPRKETGRELCDITPIEYAELFKSLRSNGSLSKASPLEAYNSECEESQNMTIGLKCSAGRSFFSVSWNGIMTGCENLNALKVDIKEKDFKKAWSQINADALSYQNPIECNSCKYNKVCFNCAAYRGSVKEKGHCNPNTCERTKLFVDEGIY